jgi:ParB-like chromosome segregation protein Spo0J
VTLPAHPAADVFPLGPDAELDELADDIRAHGLNHAIIVHDGSVVDGRRRQLACERAGIEPRFEEWNGRGGSIVDYVVSENLHRRHLTTSQRALVAVELLPHYEAEAKEAQRAAGRDHGRGSEKLGIDLPQAIRAPKASERAAAAVGVSSSTAHRAAQVAKRSPALADEIRAGTRTVDSAAKAAGVIPADVPRELGRPRYFGKGDKWAEVTQPLARYLAAWEKRDYAFRHVNPDEARRRLAVIDRLIAGLEAARHDLEPRSHRATLTAHDRR